MVKLSPIVGLLSPLFFAFFLSGISIARSDSKNYGGGVPEGSQLIQISVTYRHGDRNPKSPYPKSEFSELKYWPEGWGELTITGAKQHEKFGRALKAMYGPTGYGFLPFDYNLKYYRATSTDKDRAIMSAMANNAGLWRPFPGQEVNAKEEVQWTAVPVRVIANNEEDKEFGQNCTRAEELVKLYRNERFEELKNQHYEVFAYASEHSGYDILENPVRINWLYDVLSVEKLNKGKIPAWAERIYPQPLQSFITEYYKQGSSTEELKRLIAGPLLKAITGTMKNNTQGKDSIKMYAYSVHARHIYSILAALGAPPKKPPGYTAALIFELFKYQNSYIVRVLYRPGPDQPAVSVAVKGCRSQQVCTLKRFIEVTANLLPKDLVNECKQNL